jgi:protease PrsW
VRPSRSTPTPTSALEYNSLRDLGMLPLVLVALIEEAAKLIVPILLLLLIMARHERRLPSDGLIIGVASGMSFAALEAMGYAFTSLIESKGNIGSVEQTLFLRGLTSPAGYTAWTGLTAGALWAFLATPTGKRLLELVATFIGAVVLHTCWDSFPSLIAFVILAVLSLGWLFLALRRYRTFAEHEPRLTPLTI